MIVLGAGQSAIESAALLHENGAGVQVVARAPKLAWNGPPLPPDRSLMWRLREPISGIGTGPGHWFYARHPELFRRLPEATRVHKAQTVLGPACAHWLSDRISGQFPILLGQTLAWARTDGDGVRLGLDGPDGSRQELTADHVIAATGYRPDLRRLTFLADELRGALRTLAGTAAVDGHYQSSVPGLYFIGPAVTSAFGPLMRFVCGSDTAARTVTRHLVRATGRRALMAVGAGR